MAARRTSQRLKGKIIRVPTRLLSAEDEFFKATARRMEIAGLATRMARREGLRGAELKARIAELTANPTDEMVEKALDYGRYLTFQRSLGPAMQNIMAITQRHPWLKLFVPFVQLATRRPRPVPWCRLRDSNPRPHHYE